MRLARSGRIPPTDGESHWRFPVAPGVMLRAKGHDELIDLVFQYRLRQNIEIGDVERDVSSWYCAQYPSFCHAEAHDHNPALMRTSDEPILNRVSRWVAALVHRMPRGGYPLVSAATAESRATICAACPKQDTGWRGGCAGCSASVLALLQQVKNLRKTSKDGNLGACSIAGWENSVAAHLEIANLPVTDDQRSAMPVACWRKSL